MSESSGQQFGGRGAFGDVIDSGVWDLDSLARLAWPSQLWLMALDANCGRGPDVLPELGNMIPEVDGGQGCQVGVLSGARSCF